MMTAVERRFLAALAAGGVSRRVNDPYLTWRGGKPRWEVIDNLKARGFITERIRKIGPRRSSWVTITSAGLQALQEVELWDRR